MCRLFGNIGDQNIDQSFFETITLISKKGGPDSTLFYTDRNIQFGFNRLAILDTTENGNQPFTSESSRYTLMLNGEVYNYLELKSRYNLEGLKSGSDAEVVLHLIEKISFEKAILELNGMFAICCWDKMDEKLYLARDFAGIKPLFYSNTAEGIVFGSQFNQLLIHPWCKNWEFSEVGLNEYLQFGYMTPPYTIAENVYQLNVGEYLVYSLNSKSLVKHLYQRFFENVGNLSEMNGSLGDILGGAVKRQMVSDVPLGVFLSGGVDSALVAAKALQYESDISAITVGFEDPEYDESLKAIEYAKHLGIKNHHVERFGNQQLFEIYEEHFSEMSEPIADYSSLPTFLVSKIARKTNTVMLSGDGGDELFWGYPRFLTFANSAKYFQIPGSINRKLVRKTLKKLGFDITGFLDEQNLGKANMALHSSIAPLKIKELTGNYDISEYTKLGYAFDSLSRVKSLDYLRRNEFYYHLQKILVKVDRMSMANSLEVRVPLLDKQMILAAEQYYSSLGSNHYHLKKILKEELYTFIPKSLVEQKKKGFTPPLNKWLKNELKGEVLSTLQNVDFGGRFQVTSWDAVQQSFKNSNDNSLGIVWNLYVLAKWLQNVKR